MLFIHLYVVISHRGNCYFRSAESQSELFVHCVNDPIPIMRRIVFSIGGIPGKWAGRVGDTPLPGCGGYCTKIGGASSTGHGESIMKATVCKQVSCDLISFSFKSRKLSIIENNGEFFGLLMQIFLYLKLDSHLPKPGTRATFSDRSTFCDTLSVKFYSIHIYMRYSTVGTRLC